MGLCKCPKKKVTNLFCFEHRVNVCEHCLVANHDKCIVQSYLQWLQDSDYSPHCALCNKSLSDDTCGQCVRLTCYDVFHFSCLHLYAQALPGNTAPAGYMCPTCHAGIFPPGNMASPVADMLRQALSTVNWARAGLGLPLIEETETVKQAASSPQTTAPTQAPQSASLTPNGGLAAPPPTAHQQSDHVTLPSAELTNLSTLGMSPAPSTTKPSAQVAPLSTSTPARPGLSSHSVISVDGGTNVRNTDKQNMTEARKLFDSTKEDLLNLSHDHDDDKYKRRPAMDWLNKWLRARKPVAQSPNVDVEDRSRDTGPKYGMKKKTPTSVRKKFLVVLLIGIIGFLTLIVIFSRLSRNATDDDPFLDPMANPMIRVHAN